MLRNRSRAVTSKQAVMADNNNNNNNPSLLSLSKTPSSSPISSFLNSPRFFAGFFSKNHSEAENGMSPTSILDAKSPTNPSFVNPFGYDRNPPKSRTPSPEVTNSPSAIGLALVDSIIHEDPDEKNGGKFSKPINRTVLLGSKLKVHIPDINPTSSISPIESPKSPADFGIKTRNSQLLSPAFGATPAREFARQLSLKEMELSEDYTRVITHGPNPKTTHIFDDCIVESCCGDDTGSSEIKKMEGGGLEINGSISSPANYLSFCHTCKDILGQAKDIYMYRFCSVSCL